MTARSRPWARTTRRYAVAGGCFGAAAVLGLGCRSAEPAAPYSQPGAYAAEYPLTPAGPGSAAKTGDAPGIPGGPVVQTGAQEPRPTNAAESPARPGFFPQHPDGREEPIDLGIALRLAGVDNPTINLAQERVREALANQLAARSLLLPSVNLGGNYHKHHGTLEASPGIIRTVDSESLYLGFGARTLAAESVAFPGVRLFAHLGDAVYEPLAARQRVSARVSDSQAVQNAMLLAVTVAYLDLVGAEARLEVLRRGEGELAEIHRLTRVYAEKGQGRQADADRVAANVELQRRAIREAEGEVAVASARLCELLSLDPSVRLRTPRGLVEPYRLVPEGTDVEPLVAGALRSRPEIYARSAEVFEAQTRVRQERVRPWLPLVSVGYSGGWFGGGSNQVTPAFGPLSGRSDFDVMAVWTFQNLGLGNRAHVRRADANVGQAVAELDRTVNRIRREVTEAQADARAAARQIETTRAALATAREGFDLEMRRILQGGPNWGRPIETLDSFRQFLDARLELVRATTAYNTAQFRLFVAVGNNPVIGAPAP